jgi:hypothetical protein
VAVGGLVVMEYQAQARRWMVRRVQLHFGVAQQDGFHTTVANVRRAVLAGQLAHRLGFKLRVYAGWNMLLLCLLGVMLMIVLAHLGRGGGAARGSVRVRMICRHQVGLGAWCGMSFL